jgi:hypothetical protein
VAIGPVDQATRDLIAPLVERAGLVAAFNDAWLWIGGAMLLPLLLLPLLHARPRASEQPEPMPVPRPAQARDVGAAE